MDAVTSIFAPLCRPFVEHRDILRGGWRNRAKAKAAAAKRRSRSPQYKLRSLAAEGYLLEWSDGTSTAVRVFRHCDRLVRDGWEHPFIVRLRTIGSGGEQHCQENLLRMLSGIGISDYITRVDGNGSLKDVITPSSIFKLFSKYPDKCRKQFGMHAGDMHDFWLNLLSSPQGIELQRCHPHLRGKTAHDLRHTVCLSLHEDAGPYAKGKSTNIISWGSVTGDGRDFEQRFLFGSFISTGIANVDAAWQGWECLFDDLEFLKDGYDDNGDPILLIDGIAWGGIFIFGFADLEQECVKWGLTSWTAAAECCGICLADRTGRAYTDFSFGAGWRGTERMSNTLWKQRIVSQHPLSTSILFNKFFPRLDPMHILDHNGLAGIMLGSTIGHITLHHMPFGRNMDVRLDSVNASLDK